MSTIPAYHRFIPIYVFRINDLHACYVYVFTFPDINFINAYAILLIKDRDLSLVITHHYIVFKSSWDVDEDRHVFHFYGGYQHMLSEVSFLNLVLLSMAGEIDVFKTIWEYSLTVTVVISLLYYCIYKYLMGVKLRVQFLVLNNFIIIH